MCFYAPYSFDNLFVLVALCNMATLLPAPFLRLLPPEVERDLDEEAKVDGGKVNSRADDGL